MDKNRQITAFMPINEDHSIERVSFAVAFKSPFSAQTVFAIQSAHDAWREGLPATGSVEQTLSTPAGNINIPGVQFAFLRPDGEPTWSMGVSKNEIRIDCTLYTRWDKVWGTALGYIEKVLSYVPSVAANNNTILAIELVVKDAFAARGNYSPAEFFNSKEFIAPALLNNGPLWHCNTGWFDQDDAKTLQNVNLTGTVVNESDQQYLISIDHKQVRYLENGDSIQSLLGSKLAIINQQMIELHKKNKSLLIQLLKEELRHTIGLGV